MCAVKFHGGLLAGKNEQTVSGNFQPDLARKKLNQALLKKFSKGPCCENVNSIQSEMKKIPSILR